MRQGCVLSPDAFAVAEDRMMEKVVEHSGIGASIGDVTVTDFDFADDVAILSEVLELLTEALVVFEEEASALGLHINWAKTKIQCLDGSVLDRKTVPVRSESVEVVDRFNYLGVVQHTATHGKPEIADRLAKAWGAFGSLRKTVWDSRIRLQTKVRLYNAYVLPVLLYGSETWTITAKEAPRINAFGTKCLRQICGIDWHERITNQEALALTKQVPVTDVIRRRRLTFFGHVARMSAGADTRQLLLAEPPKLVPGRAAAGTRKWKRARGRPALTWKRLISKDLEVMGVNIPEAVVLAQDRMNWRSIVHSSRATLP